MKNKKDSFDDLLNKSEIKDFMFRAERDMFPKMQKSAMSLVIGSDRPDAKLALEVGAAVLFGKPLLLMRPRGKVMPPRLLQIADEIVEYDELDDTTAELVQKALGRILKKLEEKA
jgi:hypothetical protein